jgi:hypothetical protein
MASSQPKIVAGLCHLKDLEIVFGIDTIQVNEYGLIKIGRTIRIKGLNASD